LRNSITSNTTAAIANPDPTIVSQRSARFTSVTKPDSDAGRCRRWLTTLCRSRRPASGKPIARPLGARNRYLSASLHSISIYEATRFRLQKNPPQQLEKPKTVLVLFRSVSSSAWTIRDILSLCSARPGLPYRRALDGENSLYKQVALRISELIEHGHSVRANASRQSAMHEQQNAASPTVTQAYRLLETAASRSASPVRHYVRARRWSPPPEPAMSIRLRRRRSRSAISS